MLELHLVAFHTNGEILSQVLRYLNVLLSELRSRDVDDFINGSLNLEVLLLGPEFPLGNIVHRFEVFNAVEHLADFVRRLFSDGLPMEVDVFVQLLEVPGREFGIALDLSHQVVGEQGHLVLGLHDLLKVDYVGYISHNEQLVLTSGNVHIYLIQGDIFLVSTGAARSRLLVIGVEKLKFESRPAFIPCEELPNVARNGLFCLLLAL